MARRQPILAKISRPRLHDVLARTRLLERLDAAMERPVLWMSAQPGAGKTALVASHLEARKRSGLWYQVDAADADPASFIYHLRLAAQSQGAPKAAAALPLLTPEYLPDLAGFSRRFFRDLYACIGADATLVFDNCQEVPDDAAFHRIVAEGMAQIPPDVHVIVISRADPPTAYAALLASDGIDVVDGAQLRLTLDETRLIAARRGVADDALVHALHERSGGWAAGLTLLLTRSRDRGVPVDAEDAESLQHVFGYFAQRVFDGIAAEHRQALMQLAFLPLMTTALAEQLTEQPDVGRLLDRLYRRHLFTDRRRISTSPTEAANAAASTFAFQFHALFRSFLRHQAQTTWSAAALQAIAARAGRFLDAAGYPEAALDLHAEAGDWASYARSMAALAEGLLAQGRRETVLDRLARLPDAERHGDPWLGYWEARALMATGADRALVLFAATQQRFAEASDVAGQLACGAAAVQTLWYARLGWSEITPWVDRLEPLIAERIAFPSRGVELLTYSALHAALAFCRPAHSAIAGMTDDLLRGIDDATIDWNQRLSTATHLITFLHNAVEHELVVDLIGKVDGAVEQLPASALNRAYWFIFRAMHDLRQADYDGAAARFGRAEELAREEGLRHAEFAAMQFHTYLDLTFRKVREAELRIARLEQHPARHHPDGAMNYWVAQTMCAQLKGNVRAAHEHAQRGLAAVAQIGATYFQAVFPLLFVSALADAGDTERALEIIATSRRLSRGTYLETMEVQLLLEEAYVAITQGELARGLDKLERGLALGAAGRTRAAYIHRAVTRKPVLLALALRHGIEVDFARELVRRWRIPPPAEEIAGWPWPIAVRTLGRFEVKVDDAPIEFGRKTPRKTLALLKAVIARGGSAPDGALIDTFWPDEDGDAATRSLGAAVHRLRTLLGVPEAVVQQGGQVALDRTLVWVDAWAFERVLAGPHPSASGRDAAAASALALYGGTFLPEEEGEVWPVAMRERLRSRFVQSVSEHAARLETAGRAAEAIDWYLRGLDADNVVEPFYQGLMRCYHRLDRLPEAVSAYRRLKQTLSVTLSLPPSAGTERLYQTLRLG